MSGSNPKKPQRKLTRKDIDKVGGGAALQETPKKTEEKSTVGKSKGQPKKKEAEKATNKIMLYFNDAEIEDIEKAAELNGFTSSDKNKYVKSLVRKGVRRDLTD